MRRGGMGHALAALAVTATLGGCIAYTVAETAVDAAATTVGVAGAAVGTAARVTAGAVRLAIPDGEDEDEKDRR